GARAALPFRRRIVEIVAARLIDLVAPWIPGAVHAAASGAFPFGFRRQPARTPQRRRQPRAVRDRIVLPDEHDGMIAVALRRLAVLPDVRRGELLEDLVAARCGDHRQTANRGRGVSGGADEARVLVVGDGKASEEIFT